MSLFDDDDKQNKQTIFLKLLESGLFFALILAGSYFISSSYLATYFGTFGIESSIFNFSTEHIITLGLFPMLISILLCIFVIIGMEDTEEDCYFSIISTNLPIFAMILCVFFILFISPKIWNLWYIGSSIVCLFGTIITSCYFIFKRKNMFKFLWNTSIGGKLMVILSLLLSFGIIAATFGIYEAKTNIECESGCTHIEFDFIDQSYSYINSPNLIFITYQNQKYYVTKQCNPAPSNPEVYIIRDEIILVTKMRCMNCHSENNQTTFSIKKI